MATKRAAKNSRNTDHAKVEVRTLRPNAARAAGIQGSPGLRETITPDEAAEIYPKNAPADSQSLAVREPSKQLVEHAGTFKQWLEVKKLASQPERLTAAATQVAVKALLKQAREEKEEIYRPIKKGLDALTAKYKKLTDPLDEINEHLGRIIGQFDVAVYEAAIREAEKVATKAERKGDVQFANDVRDAAALQPVGIAGDGLRHYTVVRAKIVKTEEFFAAVLAQKVPIAVLQAMIEAAEAALSRLAKAGAELPSGVERTEEVHT